MAKKISSRKSTRTSGRKAGKVRSLKTGGKTAKKAARKTTKKAAKKTAKKAAKKTASKSRSRRKLKSPLDKVELRKFRRMLLEKRQNLLGDMSGIEAVALRKNRQSDGGDLSSLPTHPADIGSDNYEQEFTLGLLESERALLEEIDAALERIGAGTFGICLGTGEPIGKARLKACPWAKYCIEYARMLEKGIVHPDEDREAAIAETGKETENDLDKDSED